MSFSWERSTDRLWRQGIDLIGDDRGGQVGKGIEDGAMLGQSEGGEFLICPMMVSTMLRPLSRALSRNDTGSRFMLRRTRVIRARPRRSKLCARSWPM